MNRLCKVGLWLGALVLFFVLTAPLNHCEAEDTYYYAHMVERGAWGEMFHRHHLLYLPIGRAFYRSLQWVGFCGRSLPVLIAMSMGSAVVVIGLFFGWLARGKMARGWVFPLLFSYGFWRYACAAEIYLPALATVCLAWFFALQPRKMGGAIVCSAVALLLHVVSLPAVVGAGLVFVSRREWRRAALYYLSVGVIVAGAYGAVEATVGTVVFRDLTSGCGPLWAPSTWLSAAVALGHTLLSGNFLFSFPAVSERLTELFPHRMLQEEVFMGRQMVGVYPWIALGTFFVALFGLGATCLLAAIRGKKNGLFPLFAWLGGNVAIALLFEAANPEMWIFALVPLWAIVAQLLSRSPLWTVRVLVLASVMLVHNAVGGMALVKKAQGDYCRQKAAWVVQNATADDLIVVADSHSFATYLRYGCSAQILDAKFQGLEPFPPSGRVFIYDDLFNPLPAVRARSVASQARLRELADFLRPNLRCVHREPSWSIYEWISPAEKQSIQLNAFFFRGEELNLFSDRIDGRIRPLRGGLCNKMCRMLKSGASAGGSGR